MKSCYYLIPMLALPLQAITVETRPTHGVFYAGLEKQVCLQLKVDAAAADVGKKITSLSFTSGKTSTPGDITKVRLYKSTENVFTLNTVDNNRKAVEVASGTLTKGAVNFTTDISIASAGTSYYWLVYDIAAKAKGNNKIDGVCTAFTVGGATLTPTPKLGANVKKRVYGTVYPFKHRIVPYYRTHWINVWAANHLNATHFKNFTDIIHFGYTLNADGTVGNQGYAADVADPVAHAAKAREKLKKLRGTAKSRIIAGFGHVDGGLTAFYSNTTDRTARKAIAENMAKLVLEGGYDGVDIDWEYPDSDKEWEYLTYMLADLRDELAGSGVSISMAATVFYKLPRTDATDQVDFINTMSYDQQSTQHSPMSLLRDDANRCVNTLKMPKAKVVLGLPFYTNQYNVLWDQVGWNTVVSQYPNISPSVNQALITTSNGTTGHSFNGANLIKEKCKWVKNNGYGGVMIWAYDTDVQLTHKMSLGKAMYSVIKQTRR